jgi:hypothetical protein
MNAPGESVSMQDEKGVNEMSAHFSSFTPEAMTAFGQELAAELQRRRELVETTRTHTNALLAAAHQERCETEAQRRQLAAQAADARRLFTSELRSGVHALRNRFELARRDMAADLQQMATELHAASEAFRSRPGREGSAPQHNSRPAAQQHKPKRRHG